MTLRPSLFSLTAALTTLLPDVAGRATAEVQQGHLVGARQVLLAGMERIPRPVLMVLDDFHTLRDPDVYKLFASIIEQGPAHCHWLVLTRHFLPALLVGKLRVQGELLELDGDDLRFSAAEIAALAARFESMEFDAAALHLLEERTEGWAAGVHLALLSLQRRTGAPPRTAQDTLSHLGSSLGGGNRLHAEYLTAEVLAQLPATLSTFLLKCSILDRLHPDLCRAVTNLAESAALLEQVMAQQLFLRPLDAVGNGAGEWYVLHQIFRDLLWRRLHTQTPPAQVQALYRAAADWFLARDDVTQALDYLVSGGMPDLAAALLRSRSRTAMLQNRGADLRHWLSLIPATILATQPQLLLDRAWLEMASGEESVAALEQVEKLLTSHIHVPQEWSDELTALRLLRRYRSNDQSGLYADAMIALANMASTSQLARGWCLVIATMVGGAQLPGAPLQAHAQEAIAAFTACGCALGILMVAGMQALHQMHEGDHEAALATCTQAQQLMTSQHYPALEGYEHFDAFVGEVDFWLDRPLQGATFFERALNNARLRNAFLPLLRDSAGLQLCELVLGRPVVLTAAVQAEEHRLWQQGERSATLGFKAQVVIWQHLRWSALGRPAEAWSAFQQLGISLATLPTGASDLPWLALLIAYVALGKELPALTPYLEMMLRRSEDAGSRYLAIRIRLLCAHQQQQLGYHNRARFHLRQALRDIERTGYVRMLLSQPALLPTLRATDNKFAQSLVSQMAASRPVHLQHTLNEQEFVLLGHLVAGRKIADIAAALVVAPATVKYHLSRLYQKLGVKNQREAIALAYRTGLLDRR